MALATLYEALPNTLSTTAPAVPHVQGGLAARASSLIVDMRSLVAVLDPEDLSGRDAAALYGDFAHLERLVSAAKTLLAPRIADTGHWKTQGHSSPASLLATLEGGAAGQGLLDCRQEPEQKERHEDRKQGQQGADLLPPQIAPDQVEILHGIRLARQRRLLRREQPAHANLAQGEHLRQLRFAERGLFPRALQLYELARGGHDDIQVHFGGDVFGVAQIKQCPFCDQAHADGGDGVG